MKVKINWVRAITPGDERVELEQRIEQESHWNPYATEELQASTMAVFVVSGV